MADQEAAEHSLKYYPQEAISKNYCGDSAQTTFETKCREVGKE